jgi:hypothetical protein
MEFKDRLTLLIECLFNSNVEVNAIDAFDWFSDMLRPRVLQTFIDHLETALGPRVCDGSVEQALVSTVFRKLGHPARAATDVGGLYRPSHDLLHAALQTARSGDVDLASLATAFEELEPHLQWIRGNREMGPSDPIDLHSVIVGPNGFESRNDAEIGVSLLAPYCEYVDHHHPPAEVYLILSPGQWRRSKDPWFEPGIGGIVYNQPHIIHNMKAAKVPLFAFWVLPGG